MRAAELRRRRAQDGSVEPLARVWADGPGRVHVDVYEPAYRSGIESTLADGIIASDGRRLTVEDGEAFVLAMPDHYRGSRFWAVKLPTDQATAEPNEAG